MNNKPPLVFGLQMFIVLPSARGNKQQISQSSRLLAETAAAFQGLMGRLLSFKFCGEVGACVCLTNCFCVRLKVANVSVSTMSICVNIARIVQVSKASAPCRPAIISNLQMYRTGRKITINEYNMPALSNSLKSLKSIFLYCSKAVRICLN